MNRFNRFALKKLRKDKNLSQFQLGCDTDIEQCIISLLETGMIKSPSFNTVIKLADYFEVELSYFVKEKGAL